MSISWYPWKLFVRKWSVLAPLVVSAVAALALGGWMYAALRHAPQPVFLHYSTELGVDAVGPASRVWFLAALVFFCTVVNALAANMLMLSSRRIAYIVAYASVPLAALAWWLGFLIVRLNGV